MNLSHAITLLSTGHVVAIPTETVYGLAADATDATAVRHIFDIKRRPSDNPLIIHCDSPAMIAHYTHIQHPLEQLIIDTLMPGPLTLVIKKNDLIPSIVSAGLDTVCVRIPDHILARQLIHGVGKPLAAPSANTSGRPSPTTAQMVRDDLGDRVTLVVDGGRCLFGIESTVIRVDVPSQTIQVLRPGYIIREDLQDFLTDQGYTDRQVDYTHDDAAHASPGTRHRHYAPHAPVHIISDDTIDTALAQVLQKNLGPIGVIATDEFLVRHHDLLYTHTHRLIIYPRGTHTNLLMCAQSLYQLYHHADQDSVSTLVIESLPPQGLGYAIMNRVRKSAEG